MATPLFPSFGEYTVIVGCVTLSIPTSGRPANFFTEVLVVSGPATRCASGGVPGQMGICE
jgi:hypothetical protein